jgi:hypothetical protein
VEAVVGADVVAAGESFSADKLVSATHGPTSDVVGTRMRAFQLQSLSWDHRCCCRGPWRVARSLSPRMLSGVEVVHTRGGGTGVPFVMAP